MKSGIVASGEEATKTQLTGFLIRGFWRVAAASHCVENSFSGEIDFELHVC